MSIERHHILHEKRQWKSQEPQEALRNAKGMIVPLHHRIHRPELHANSPAVPLLSYHLAKKALDLYIPSPDGVEAILNMEKAILKASEHPRAHKIEQDLARLAIRAMKIQIPYIELGQMGDSY